MQYLLLIYDNETAIERDMPETEYSRMMDEYRQFTETLAASGKLVSANRLLSVTNATTVRVREGKRELTDGPFAETREQLGGYYLVNAKNLDEATELAAQIPSVRIGSIEIRPVHENP
ncbi:MAG TPA: YciI family protein [Kofleriaceae bacterium]